MNGPIGVDERLQASQVRGGVPLVVDLDAYAEPGGDGGGPLTEQGGVLGERARWNRRLTLAFA
ncbi:hypothetical protein ABGB16_18195 [Micromonospora sp. B11E3]|uniref:hypothetical protein n=1 Tax=Micromonospora sp. B11E3 TaxID=3153562 RepID=UPI00325D98AD